MLMGWTVAIIYIPSFIKIGSGIQKLIWRIHTDRMDITKAYFIEGAKNTRNIFESW
jgi:hypothetical protein